MKKNGFTLVELIVCIVIVSILAIAIGVNTSKMIDKNNIKENVKLFERLFESASTYTELASSNCSYGCTFTFDSLSQSGLLSQDYYKMNNPMFNNNTKFNSTDTFSVTISNGKKIISFTSNTCTISNNSLENFEWGKC